MERELDQQGRPVALPIFDHQTGSKLEVFRLPKRFRTLADVIQEYTLDLIPDMKGVFIRFKGPDSPECLPVALVSYREYKVFVKDMTQVLGVAVRFRDYIALEEVRLRCRVWSEIIDLIGMIRTEVAQEAAKKAGKVRP